MKEEICLKSKEQSRILFEGKCEFVLSTNKFSEVPITKIPEIAIFGRSNVGKSSLINSITRTKALARVSKTPGRTRQLIFFRLSNRLQLVDLPGYGYAKVSKKEKLLWFKLIKEYLKKRQNLTSVLILIDSRRGIMEIDEEIMKYINDCAISWTLVLTKIDKISENKKNLLKDEILIKIKSHVAAFPNVWETSSKTKFGILELRDHISRLALPKVLN